MEIYVQINMIGEGYGEEEGTTYHAFEGINLECVVPLHFYTFMV